MEINKGNLICFIIIAITLIRIANRTMQTSISTRQRITIEHVLSIYTSYYMYNKARCLINNI